MVAEEKIYRTNTIWSVIGSKLQDYIQLGKLRLSAVVVFSAGIAYLIAAGAGVSWHTFGLFLLGGLLITLGANALNEIIEIKTDAKMRRTSIRPLPSERMTVNEAAWFSLFTTLIGIAILGIFANPLAAGIGLFSWVLYALVYTPLKRYGSLAVWVGAIPGALPVVIGWAAARGDVPNEALVLFAIQFMWQLPHFWAIGWLAHEDYTAAGFRLLPNGGERNIFTALKIAVYTLPILPLSFLPFYTGLTSLQTTYYIIGCSLFYFLQTIYLVLKLSRRAALLLMFGSFIYLPAVLILILLDKL